MYCYLPDDNQTMFNDNRMQLLDVKDWIDLIQLLLFPTVKDTINNLMNIEFGWQSRFIIRHVIELPRGRKFSNSVILQTIIEVLPLSPFYLVTQGSHHESLA